MNENEELASVEPLVCCKYHITSFVFNQLTYFCIIDYKRFALSYMEWKGKKGPTVT